MPKRPDPANRGKFIDAPTRLLIRSQRAKADKRMPSANRLYSRMADAVDDQLVQAVYAKLGDWQQAEDAVQDALLQGFEQIERFDPAKGSAFAWLLNMSTSRWRDNQRRKNRKSLPFMSWPSTPSDDGEFDPEAPSRPFDSRAHCSYLLDNYIETLSTFDRNLLRFRRFGFTYAQIREVMPTSSSIPYLSRRTKQLIRECRRFWHNNDNEQGVWT